MTAIALPRREILRPSVRDLVLRFMGAVQAPFAHPVATAGAAAAPAAGWWLSGGVAAADCWAAYQPKGAASYAASKLDLNTGGNNATDGAAFPAWDNVNGWKFAGGSSQYLKTAFVPNVITQNQTIICRFAEVALAGILAACRDAGTFDRVGLYDDATVAVQYWNGRNISVAPGLVTGNLAVSLTRGYRNGVAEGAAIVVGTTALMPALYIGCRNTGGVLDLYLTGNIQAMAIYSPAITAPQVAAVSAAAALL